MIGFTLNKSSAKTRGAFEKDGGVNRRNFSHLTKTLIIAQTRHESLFWAETREQVDRVAKIVREAGGQNLKGRKSGLSSSPGYYALFFEDPDGNKLEICCRGSAIVAD